MQIVRTPDERFADLPDYRFPPHYAEIHDGAGGTLRVHYVDEGPADAAPVVLMHGEPSWSYLYRHMIPPLLDAGHRVVAPDLVGFGRSDKPTELGDSGYAGLIGLRLVAAEPGRFARVVVANTGLPTGLAAPSEAFLFWKKFARQAEDLPVGNVVNGGCTTDLKPEVIAAYDAPFPDRTYKAGARSFPDLVPTSIDDPASPDNIAAWKELERFSRPFLTAFSDEDPLTGGGDAPFRAKVPGAAGRPHTVIKGGGHFLQEDRGPEVARVLNEFIAST